MGHGGHGFSKIKVQILFLDTRVVGSACVRGDAAALFILLAVPLLVLSTSSFFSVTLLQVARSGSLR